MNKPKTHTRGCFRWSALIAFVLFCACVTAGCVYSERFAEWCSTGVSHYVRSIIAALTRHVPFSLAEVIVVLGTLIIAVCLVVSLIRAIFCRRRGAFFRMLLRLVYLALLLACFFVLTFGVCYRRVPLETRMQLDTEHLTELDMRAGASYLLAVCDQNLPAEVGENGSKMPYRFDYMAKQLEAAFKRTYQQECPTYFSVKKVMLSKPWTYTHISGMYMPFTAECNINVNYPDFIIVYSTAHEMAHHMGVASEDEANLIALDVCLHADDAYIRYAGALGAADYMLGELPSPMARELLSACDARVRAELAAYAAFFDEYRDAPAAVVANNVNDTYLKAQGVTEGTRSYDRVSLLAAAYIKQMTTENQGE